jgi:biopolymer transport protein ExbD
MAEMEVQSGGHKKGPGVKKAKKLSTRVDLTPMVDLGFLLITFFMYTTTMSEPKVMKLNMPKDAKDEKEETKIKQSGALTILLGKKDQVYYYMGMDALGLQSTTYKQIRKVILDKKASVANIDDFMVIIKPNDDASYQNVVDIVDEMLINVVERYAIIPITADENELVKRTETANGIQ